MQKNLTPPHKSLPYPFLPKAAPGFPAIAAAPHLAALNMPVRHLKKPVQNRRSFAPDKHSPSGFALFPAQCWALPACSRSIKQLSSPLLLPATFLYDPWHSLPMLARQSTWCLLLLQNPHFAYFLYRFHVH